MDLYLVWIYTSSHPYRSQSAMQEDKETVRLRVACDRCHSQKLRCPKATGAEKCDRCSKARTPCVFSPFRQKKEPCNKNGEGRADLNAQLSRLEERIGTVKENNRNAIANFDAKAVAGAKRKRNSSLQRDTSYPTPEETTPDAISTYPDPPFCISDATGFDWTSTSFPMFNDFEPGSALDDIDLYVGSVFPPIDFGSSTTNQESHNQKTKDFCQMPPSSARFLENDLPNPRVDRAPAPPLAPRVPARKHRTIEFSWEDSISTAHPRSQKHLIHQLSQLSIGLYDHMSTIPPQSIHDNGPVPFGDSAACGGCTPSTYTGYSLDDTFKLTQDLIDIYPAFIDTFLKGHDRSSNPSCHNTNTPSTQASSPPSDLPGRNAAQASKTSPSNPIRHDHASILLLLSCHVRVIDIYDELFKHMAVCMVEVVPPTKAVMDGSFALPELSIGSYNPPPSSSIPMQMMLLVHLAAQLSDNAAELAAHLRGPLSEEEKTDPVANDGARDEAAMLSLAAAEKVEGRASNMSQQLRTARTTVLNSGYFA